MTAQSTTLTSEERTAAETASGARILKNYIGGSWVPAKASGLMDVSNPANGEVLARVPLSGPAEVEAAVAAANAAWPDWRSRSIG